MSQNYDFTISTAFPNGEVDPSRLSLEIAASAIITALDHIDTASDTCSIWFKAVLSETDEGILATLVAAHSGEPLAIPPQEVSIAGLKMEYDGRIATRNTAVISAKNFHMKAFSFKPGDPSTLIELKVSGTSKVSVSHVTMLCYDASNTITTDPSVAVKTVVDYEPPFDYEVMSGRLNLPEAVRTGNTDLWYIAVIAVPDLPAIYGGSVEFVAPVHLESVTDPYVVSDGRASKYLTYDATYHTNKLRWILWHPTGTHPRFQIFLEAFK